MLTIQKRPFTIHDDRINYDHVGLSQQKGVKVLHIYEWLNKNVKNYDVSDVDDEKEAAKKKSDLQSRVRSCLSSNQVFVKGDCMDWKLESMSRIQGRITSSRRASNPIPAQRVYYYDETSSRSGSYSQSFEAYSNNDSPYGQTDHYEDQNADRERSGHSQVRLTN